MDVFAHTLWTAYVYKQWPLRQRLWAAFFGVAPDLFSFGLFFVQRLLQGFFPLGKPELITIPQYVYTMYTYTHSLVVFAAAVLVLYFVNGRRVPWVMGGWGLHIFIDMFTHGRDFFPTPFLWPLSHVTINSYSWGEPWFMAFNYGLLAVVYVVWYWVSRRRAVTTPR